MYRYNIHGIKIKSDVKLPIPSHFKSRTTNLGDLGYDLVIERGDSDVSGTSPVAQPYLFYKDGYLVHNYKMVLPCNLSIENLEESTKIKFTWLYEIIPKLNQQKILDYIIDLKFIQKGMLKIHGSSVEHDGKGIMIAGWDGCGKSTLSLRFIDKGAKFLSDDTTIVDRKYAYSYPKKIKAFRGASGIKWHLKDVPVINKFLGIYEKVIPKIIAEKTEIDYIFIPTYGKKSIRRMTKKEVLSTMLTLNTYRTKTRDSRNLVLAYCFYSKYDLDSLMSSRKRIIGEFLKNTACYEIKSRNVDETMELIDSILKK